MPKSEPKYITIIPDEHTRIHEICKIIRYEAQHGECNECPARINTPYGPAMQGCYMQAWECFNLAVFGNHWGKITGSDVPVNHTSLLVTQNESLRLKVIELNQRLKVYRDHEELLHDIQSNETFDN